jgi:transcriptional regulator with XRE-family HTH domain
MLGDELRKARQDAGMSQEKVALQAGVDRSYLSELENNRWSPTVEMLFRICDTLGVLPSEVISRVEQSRKQ